MKILEVADRTPDLINQLLEVWEKSVRATHLFLSDREIKNIKEYVPQALNGIAHLMLPQVKQAAPWPLWGLRTARWRCCLSPRKSGEKGSANA